MRPNQVGTQIAQRLAKHKGSNLSIRAIGLDNFRPNQLRQWILKAKC